MTGATAKILLSILAITIIIPLQAQESGPSKSYLLTGVVLDVEERQPMPYVNVKLKDTFYGTATDANGYFSLFLNPGDTLEFTYVGYETASFIMPYKLEEQQYTLLQLMRKDTLVLEEVVIFPWPSYQNFVDAFLDTRPEDTRDIVVEVKQDLQQTMNEAEMSRYYHEQQRYQRLFMMHRIFPANNFLDPSRWSDFIRDLRTDNDE